MVYFIPQFRHVEDFCRCFYRNRKGTEDIFAGAQKKKLGDFRVIRRETKLLLYL